MESENKEWVDNASYEELLRKWRFAPLGSANDIFNEHYRETMFRKKDELTHEEQVAVSKRGGWGK